MSHQEYCSIEGAVPAALDHHGAASDSNGEHERNQIQGTRKGSVMKYRRNSARLRPFEVGRYPPLPHGAVPIPGLQQAICEELHMQEPRANAYGRKALPSV
jgi:hypothetical protein